MTIKEIAGTLGKTERSVQRWIKKLSDKMSSIKDKMSASSPMNPADYDLDETIKIIEVGMGKNAAAIFRQNAEHLNSTVPPESKQLDRLDRLESMVEKLVVSIPQMVRSILTEIQPAKQIEYKQDYYSVIGYANSIGITDIAFSDAIKLGRDAARESRITGIEIRKIPDERFGHVNSYHVDILKKVFQV
jgi:hypothetical protein